MILIVSTMVGSHAAAETRLPNLGLGYEYNLSGTREEFLLPDPIVDPSVAPDHPLYVRVRAPWALLEPRPGEYDWSEVDRIVDPYRAANFVVGLCLHGTNPAIDPGGGLPSPARPVVLKAWLEFNRAAALHFRGRVRYYEIGDEPNREAEWPAARAAEFAYVLKNSSVTIRSADPDALVAQGGLALGAGTLEADLAWQEALYREEIATYVDVLPVHPAPDSPLGPALARAYDLLLANDPSAQLWASRVSLAGEGDRARASDLVAKFIVGQGEGAAVVTFDLEADVEGQPEFPGVLLDLHKLFLPTYSRVTGGGVGFAPYEGPAGGRLDGVTAYRFFDAASFQGLIGFFAPAPPPDGRARLTIDTAAVQGVAIYDIIGGAAGPIRSAKPDFKRNTTAVPVFIFDRPQVLQYARVPIKGFEADRERLEIADTGLVTAEEVIAGHQSFMADQNHRLRNYRARALLTYHGKLGGSDTIDVTFDNNFFLDPAEGADWEQTALYYNGVRWKGEKLPELPIPQPEKVFTLPLDINLNKDYTYDYRGREKVGGYDCHVVEFRPIDRSKALYEGRVWVEARTFAPVRLDTVQLNLKPPLLSNEEKDLFTPVAGPDGTTYWLRTRIEGQQIMSFAGRNIVLLREIDFSDVQINDPSFAAARQHAWGSNHSMLRDTDRGLRYLEKTDGGERRVKEGMRRSALLAGVGLYRQEGLDAPVLPLAGVDYFNYAFGGKNNQLNALLFGLVNVVTFADPDLGGSRVDLSAEAQVIIPRFDDRFYVRGDEREDSRLKTRAQTFSGSIGGPLGNFFRIKGVFDVASQEFGPSSEAREKGFLVPVDTWVGTAGAEFEFNRAGWTVAAAARRSARNRWEAWGDTTPPGSATLADFPASACDAPGSCLADFDPDQETFDTWHAEVAKQVFLPRFQKLRFAASWDAGSRLDRFSALGFSFFGSRVRGFAGSGVRYDRGGIARAQYAFNVADLIRLDASLDHAVVREGLSSGETQRFTGLGFSGNVMGPWQTIIQFDVGIALQSDIPDLRGNTEFLVGLLKYF